MTFAEIKRRVQAGQVYDVTNHFITRHDHASFGTTRRVVVRTTASRIYLSMAAADLQPGHAGGAREIDWPKASQVQMDGDGVIRLYGGSRAGQKPERVVPHARPRQERRPRPLPRLHRPGTRPVRQRRHLPLLPRLAP